MMTLARTRRSSRAAIVLFGCAVAWMMGVKAPRAASFEVIDFAGHGRSTLVIEEVLAGDAGEGDEVADDARFGTFEIFATMTYGTEISVFSHGLYARTPFTLPRSGDGAVLVIDVDRGRGARRWEAGDPGLRARLYTVASAGGGSGTVRFDGVPVSGSLELEAAIVGRREAGFRIRGWLELVDAGPDGLIDSADDTTLEVDVVLESVPTPEAIARQPELPPRQPQGGFCEIPWCWTDAGYYDPYTVGYGCGDAEVGYETADGGCDGDTVDDGGGFDGGGGVIDDGSGGSGGGVIDDGDEGSSGGPGFDEVAGDDGCSGQDDSGGESAGCEGTDDGSASDGCDGGDSGDSGGCDDSSSSSSGCGDSGGGGGGCGSSGCEGDTLQRDRDDEEARSGSWSEPLSRRAGLDLVGLVLFASALATWISDRARGRKR